MTAIAAFGESIGWHRMMPNTWRYIMWFTRGETLKGGAILLTGTVAMPSFASMAQAEDAAGTVQAIHVKWHEAFNQGDAAALTRLYLPDARVMPPRGVVATSGKSGGGNMFDPSKYWTGRFHKMTIRCSLIVLTSIFASLSVSHPAVASPEVKQMQVNGTTLSYVEEGTGEPVIFVHGAISDMRAWDDYRARIAGKRRFIAYTQRYFGTGEWPDKAEHFSRETHTEDLIGLIKALNAGPVHLVTWSYSGGIGTYAVLKRPDLFRSIVHFEPAADALVAGVPGSIVSRKEMLKAFGPAMKAVKAGQLEDAALRFVEAVFRMPEGAAASEPEPWPTYWRENGRTIPPLIGAHPGATISCEHLRAIDVPTLVVQGENTYTRYSMMAENLSRCQANALLVTMPAVTHDGPYRKPDEFAALIENFLALVD